MQNEQITAVVNGKAMINAKELRIGNMVSPKDTPDGTIGTILEIRREKVIISWKQPNLDCSGPRCYKDIQPIPLTGELLERCGFIHYEDFWRLQTSVEGMALIFLEREGHCFYYCRWVSTNVSYPVKYTHQLQNLYFSITGLELEINL